MAITWCLLALVSLSSCSVGVSAACVSQCHDLPDGNYISCQGRFTYVLCIDGVLYDLPCPRGSEWDEVRQSCHITPTCSDNDAKCYTLKECGTDVLEKIFNNFVLKSKPKATAQDTFCLALYEPIIEKPAYVIHVNIWNDWPTTYGHPALIFNAKDSDNYDSIFFRTHSQTGCLTTGYVERGKWTNVDQSTCPTGPPLVRTWFDVAITVKTGEAKVYLNGLLVTTMKPRFTVGGRCGVALLNNYDNTIFFKSFHVQAMN